MLPLALLLSLAAPADARPTLVGLATLPADTFRPGPTSGQFIDHPAAPFDGRQPVQGISSLTPDPANAGSYLALSDNGFGTKANSADYVLCVYRVTPDFESGEVAWELAFELNDRDEVIDWPTVADGETYPDSDVPVAEAIRAGRLLTGADFDVESMVALPDGTLWLGDEFGPFLLHVDADGMLLAPPVGLPGEGMHSPDHPTADPATARVRRSGGFEASTLETGEFVALTALLERPMPDGFIHGGLLRLDEPRWQTTGPIYPLPDDATAVGGMDAYPPDGRTAGYVLIERDGEAGPAAVTKRLVYLDAESPQPRSVPLIDLLALHDLGDLDGDGSDAFRFDHVTIESIVVLDDRTLLVCNDNNYPFPGTTPHGETPDDTRFLLIRLPRPIAETTN